MKSRIVFFAVFLVAFMVPFVSAAITYNAGTNTITVTGTNGGIPYTFLDLYNADVAGGWGVVTKTSGDRQFQFNAKIVIGDAIGTVTTFTDTNKQIFFNNIRTANGQSSIYVRADATFTLGTFTNNVPLGGCHLIFNEPTYYGYGVRSDTGIVSLYDCVFSGIDKESWVTAQNNYKCTFSQGSYVRIAINNVKIQDCLFSGSWGIRQPSADTITNNVYITATSYPLWIQTYSASISNVYVTDLPTWSEKIRVELTGANNHYLTNIHWKDTWELSWIGTNTGQVNRQYTFNLNVKDSMGASIQNASVTLYRADGIPAFTALTDVYGSIPEQTVTRGYYTQPTGSNLNDYGPFNLTVTATGYQPHSIRNITLSEPVDWEIALDPTPPPTGSNTSILIILVVTVILIAVSMRRRK